MAVTKKLKCSKPNSCNRQILKIVLLILALTSFGCLMVYSASFYSANYHYGNSYFFLFKQILGVVLGIFAMIFFSFVDYHLLKKYKTWIIVISIILLVLVFVPGLGMESYGAKRWISILGFSIQPSEIAKFALVIFIAGYMSDNHDKVKTFKGLLPVLCVAGVICVLTMLEPSMSVTMCIGFVTLFMLIIGGMSKKHTLMFSIPAAAVVPLLVVLEPYRLRRLMAFIDPWASPQGEGFQLIQSLYSLGSGGLFGVGLFNSRQKYLFLPFAESDFILSIIGEEIGFVGLIVLIAYERFSCPYLQPYQNCTKRKRQVWRDAGCRRGFYHWSSNSSKYCRCNRFNSANRTSTSFYFKWRNICHRVYGWHWHLPECFKAKSRARL